MSIAIRVHIDCSPDRGWFFAADGCTIGQATKIIWGQDPTLGNIQPKGFKVNGQSVDNNHILQHDDMLEILTGGG